MDKADSNEESKSSAARMRAIAVRARWLVPLIALATIALSLLKLDVGPVGWAKPVEETAGRVTWIAGEPAICILLSLTVLTYWAVRERREAAADLAMAAAWLTGIPGMTIVAGWIVKGTKIMFATLKRKVYEQIRDEGRVEGHAEGRTEGHAEGRMEGHAEGRMEGHAEASTEWRAWLQRRTRTGTFVPDPDDPPPDRSG